MANSSQTHIIVVSDSVAAGSAQDRSGQALKDALDLQGFGSATLSVVPDGVESVSLAINDAAEVNDLVVTTGGTGFGPRDLTPEATRSVIEREAPGLSEAMRSASPRGLGRLSRGVCGTIGSTLVINVPGSPKGAVESLEAIADVIGHILELLRGEKPH